MTRSYCDDCGAKAGLPIGLTVPGFYGKCPRCNITRACYGTDPDPQKPRKIRIPEWPTTYPLR